MKKYILSKLPVIKKEESSKFWVMFFIGSCVIFNFVMLRNLKDPLVSTLKDGMNNIPLIKMYMVLPASIFFMFLYTSLSNYYNSRDLFMLFVSFFLVFFMFYAIFFANSTWSPAILLFYTFAECWGTVAFGTAMWAFFNDICSMEQAKRFYVLISGAQFGSLVATGATLILGTFLKDVSVRINIFLVALSCISIIVVVIKFGHLLFEDSSYILMSNERMATQRKKSIEDGKKFFGGLFLVFRSYYLSLIFVITLCYNLSIGVVEFIWKKNASQAFPIKEDFMLFNAKVGFWTTFISSLIALFFAVGIIDKLGVAVALSVFPLVFGFMTTFYFFFSMNPWGGALHWIVSKTVKYSFADPAKQVLYIPQSPDERHKAKSVIDILGARGGKAAGSVFNQVFLREATSTESAVFSYPIILFMVMTWFISSVSIGLIFKRKEVVI